MHAPVERNTKALLKSRNPKPTHTQGVQAILGTGLELTPKHCTMLISALGAVGLWRETVRALHEMKGRGWAVNKVRKEWLCRSDARRRRVTSQRTRHRGKSVGLGALVGMHVTHMFNYVLSPLHQ